MAFSRNFVLFHPVQEHMPGDSEETCRSSLIPAGAFQRLDDDFPFKFFKRIAVIRQIYQLLVVAAAFIPKNFPRNIGSGQAVSATT